MPVLSMFYAVFQAARVVAGPVEWPAEVDLSYDTLYVESQPVAPAESAQAMTR